MHCYFTDSNLCCHEYTLLENNTQHKFVLNLFTKNDYITLIAYHAKVNSWYIKHFYICAWLYPIKWPEYWQAAATEWLHVFLYMLQEHQTISYKMHLLGINDHDHILQSTTWSWSYIAAFTSSTSVTTKLVNFCHACHFVLNCLICIYCWLEINILNNVNELKYTSA